MNSSGLDIQLYLEEGFLAAEPIYGGSLDDFRTVCLVHTFKTSHQITCSMRTFSQNLAAWFHVDLVQRNKEMAKVLKRRRNLPLVFSEEIILIKIKTRTGAKPKDETNALINARMVASVSGSFICMKNGERFGALASESTIINQLVLADQARFHLAQKRAWLKSVSSPKIR